MEYEMRTLNEWLRKRGLSWVDGREVLYKGVLTSADAETIISNLIQQGAVR